MKSATDRELARIQAVVDSCEASLTPEQHAEEKARLAAFAKREAASFDYMKNVLRRLGVQSNLDDHSELWLQLWATAHHVGFSDEEFWLLTPRQLFAVLELKVRELERLERRTGEPERPRGKVSQAAESAHMPGGQEAQVPKKGHNGKKPVRRNAKYERIDKALRGFAAARPKSHDEVFRLLDDRKVAIPNRIPFKSAGGWLKGWRENRHSASAWLSQAWTRLSLPAFPRGPKK